MTAPDAAAETAAPQLRPYDWSRETAEIVAGELLREAATMRRVADALDDRADGAELGSLHLRGAVHGYRQAAQRLEDDAAEIVRTAQIFWDAYEAAASDAR